MSGPVQHDENRENQVDGFLLAEYSQIADSFLKNEELGEARVSFYVILVTAIIGGGITLLDIGDFPNIRELFIITSVILYLFGFLVLKRMIKRNISTDEYLRALSLIRNYFASKDTEVVPYLLFYTNKTIAREYTTRDLFGKNGGLVEMVSFLNSIIVGVTCYLLLDLYNVSGALVFSTLSVLLSWVLNYYYIKGRYARALPPVDKVDVIQAAGGVLWRDESRNELLVIHRDRYDDWTLPKGKLMKGEGWSDAAIREVKEETGIKARLLGYAGCNSYDVEGVPKIVIFWNMVPLNEAVFKPNMEGDMGLWLSVDEAVDKLQYPGEKMIIQKYVT